LTAQYFFTYLLLTYLFTKIESGYPVPSTGYPVPKPDTTSNGYSRLVRVSLWSR